jgi:ribonucleoside-diphosphate reductase alpha chain
MDLEQKILSDITVFMKYAKHLPYLERRELWEEICERNKEMHINKFPELKEDIEYIYKEFILPKKILPAMRSLQFAGKPIEINNARMFNCSYCPIDSYESFSEAMFLLLSGCGFGFSVQKHHVEKLPEIIKPTKKRRYLIGDNIEGWSDSIKILIKSYFGKGSKPIFDFRDIRPKGAMLITSGGKAPGPEPLKRCLFEIEQILESKQNGEKLRPIDCYSIICHIADAVLSGGIRRSATIALFSFDDEEMLSCKSGNWWEINPHFARANNSVVILLNRIKKKEFFNLWDKIKASGAGEPGIYFTNDPEYGTNPCVETSLRAFTFCNLVEINGADIIDQNDFNERCWAAGYINTLQASYTDFHYLRDIWKTNTEKDALIGVGITGIASSALFGIDKKQGAEIVKQVNEQVAKWIGINKAARCCVVKPAGTSSLVLGCSSGIHGYHNDYYIRRLRVGKNESIYQYLIENHPLLVEDELFKPQTTAVISIPQKAPKGSILRTESAISLLERTKEYNIDWVRESHRSGPNYHNVSATISIKDNEWEQVGNWMWENKKTYHGLSILPYSGHSYVQAPFENITEQEYNKLIKHLHNIDLSKVVELTDVTNLKMEAACSGNGCEVV